MRISDWSSDVCASDLVELHRTLLDSEDRTLIVGVEIFGATRGNAGDVELQVVREFDPAVRGNAARPFRRIGGAGTGEIVGRGRAGVGLRREAGGAGIIVVFGVLIGARRSEARRAGKECVRTCRN